MQKKVHVYLSPEQTLRLKVLARLRGLRHSELIRRAVDELLLSEGIGEVVDVTQTIQEVINEQKEKVQEQTEISNTFEMA